MQLVVTTQCHSGGELLGVGIALVLPVLLIQFFGYGEDSAKGVASDALLAEEGADAEEFAGEIPLVTPAVEAKIDELIAIPMEGKVVPLEEVLDPVFSGGIMGAGVGIEPTSGVVTAPFDGKVILVADSKHAIGLQSEGGVELLIHVGLETVGLGGAPFEVHVSQGDKVSKGQLLIKADLVAIKAAGLPTITPVVVTNTTEFSKVEILTDDTDLMLVHK